MAAITETHPNSLRATESPLVTTLQVTYALHTIGLVIGALGASTVLGSFIFGWPSIIAVVINYIKRNDAKGTWLESHFQWQIRTFWYAVLASIVIGVAGAFLAIVLVGFAIWAIGFFALGIWAIYRIAIGWTRLNDHRAIA